MRPVVNDYGLLRRGGCGWILEDMRSNVIDSIENSDSSIMRPFRGFSCHSFNIDDDRRGFRNGSYPECSLNRTQEGQNDHLVGLVRTLVSE